MVMVEMGARLLNVGLKPVVEQVCAPLKEAVADHSIALILDILVMVTAEEAARLLEPNAPATPSPQTRLFATRTEGMVAMVIPLIPPVTTVTVDMAA